MIIKASGPLGVNRVIAPIFKSFNFEKPINGRPRRCSFRTEDEIQEWDEVIVYENDGTTKIFGGGVDSVNVDRASGMAIFTVSVGGYSKLFDRLRVNKTYDTPGQTLGDIVSDIIANFTEGFTDTNVVAGPVVDPPYKINFQLPSVAITNLTKSYGYSWLIDDDRDVHTFEKSTLAGPFTISPANADKFKDLEFSPTVENFANVVIIRGGVELSAEQDKEFVADGIQTVFLLPEFPHDIAVEVDTGGGYVPKSIGPKLGETAPTTDFVVNYAEKYVENGTLATLAAGNKIKIFYKYEYPIRLQRKNIASIEAMKLLFPGTNGEFQHVIDDDTITSRAVAQQYASEYLANHANTEVSGSFSTDEQTFEEGQILTIDEPEFSGEAVVQKIKTTSIGGGVFRHIITFATVLYDFEDFLRELLQAKKTKIDDNESVEILTDFEDGMQFSEAYTISKDAHRIIDTMEIADTLYTEKNKPIQYVLGPYFPVSFADNKRVFNLGLSALG